MMKVKLNVTEGQKDFYRLDGKRNVVTGVETTNVSTDDPGLI